MPTVALRRRGPDAESSFRVGWLGFYFAVVGSFFVVRGFGRRSRIRRAGVASAALRSPIAPRR